MSWLRIDDGYDTHPKLLELTEPQRWRWTRLLIHCARHKTEGHVKKSVLRELGLGRAIDLLLRLGLLEPSDDAEYVVHDWSMFNPKDPGAAERMRRIRAAAPQPRGGQWEKTRAEVFARDNGICVDCGDFDESWNADHDPSREELIAHGESIYDIGFIYTRCHSCHAKKTRRQANTDRTQDRTPTEHKRTQTEPEPPVFGASRVGARARPVPSPTPEEQEPVPEPSLTTPREPRANGTGDEHGPQTLGPSIASALANLRPPEDDPWPT